MCGIFGVLRKRTSNYWAGSTDHSRDIDKTIVKYFTYLAMQSKSRGEDSTGIFMLKNENNSENVWTKNPELFMYKNNKPSTEFIEETTCKSILSKANESTNCIIGHTRAATSGDPLYNKNNHPFVCGRIVGVHNGIISNWRELAEEYGILLKSECDSEIIFALINKFLSENTSIISAVQKMAGVVKGSMACAFLDLENCNQVVLFRRGAPLNIKTTKSNAVLLFASENIFLERALVADSSGNYRTYESTTGIIGDNTGVILKTFAEYDWLIKSISFPVQSPTTSK